MLSTGVPSLHICHEGKAALPSMHIINQATQQCCLGSQASCSLPQPLAAIHHMRGGRIRHCLPGMMARARGRRRLVLLFIRVPHGCSRPGAAQGVSRGVTAGVVPPGREPQHELGLGLRSPRRQRAAVAVVILRQKPQSASSNRLAHAPDAATCLAQF